MAIASLLFYADTSIVLYILRNKLEYVFWLGVIAHAQLFMVVSGFVAQLVKRRTSITKQGISLEDEGVKPNELQTQQEISTTP